MSQLMNPALYKRAFPIVAQMVADTVGITLVMNANQAYCGLDKNNAKRRMINIPSLPLDLTQQQVDVALGYLYHECFHAIKTDFGVFTSVRNPFQRSLLNVVEDVWDEHYMPDHYFASKAKLDAVNAHVLAKGGFSVPGMDVHPAEVMSRWVLYYGKGHYNNTACLKPLADATEAVLSAMLPASVFQSIKDEVVQRLPCIGSTEDSLALTDRLIAILQDALEEPESEQSNQGESDEQESSDSQEDGDSEDTSGGSSGDNQNDDHDESESSDTSPSDADADDEQGEGEPSSDASNTDQANEGNSGQGDSSTDEADEQGESQEPSESDAQADSDKSSSSPKSSSNTDAEKREAIQQMLDATEDECLDDTMEIVAKELIDMSKESDDSMVIAPVYQNKCDWSSRKAERCLSNAIQHTQHISRELVKLVNGQAKNSRIHREFGSRIDSHRLASVVTGNTKLYVHETYTKAKTSAIHLCLDTSGSMGSERRLETAMESAMALSLAIEKMRGVEFSATHFPCYQFYDDPEGVAWLIKRGGLRQNLKNFNVKADGCTPMAEAMWHGMFHLLSQSQDQKILFVVGDGAPDSSAAVFRAVEFANHVGIKLIGIGIKCPLMSRYFAHHLLVDNVSELPGQFMKALGQTLLAS